MRNHIPALLTIAIVMTLFASCKRNDNDSNINDGLWGTGNCRPASIEGAICVYDSEDRLVSIGNNIMNFTYFQGGYCVVKYNPTANYIDTFLTDKTGRIIEQRSNALGPNSHREFVYDRNDRIIYSIGVFDRSPSPPERDTTAYLWEDGDLASVVDARMTVNYTYSEDPYQIGDANGLSDLYTYGRPMFRTRHLVTSKIRTARPLVYTYEFDSRHHIIKSIAADSVVNYVTSATLTYDCK